MLAKFDSYRLIYLLPIRRHCCVADVGCGTSPHTVPLGKYLFAGKVFAVDVDQEKLDATRNALANERLTEDSILRQRRNRPC